MMAARSDPAIAAAAQSTGADGNAAQDDLARIVAKAVARIVVQDWEGVGDADGKALPLTPEGLDALLEVWPIFEAFQTRYIAGGLILDAEKNASPPSPRGFGGGAYCEACPSPCEDCPSRVNAPQTPEGWQIWDLVQRLGGQLRLSGHAVIGCPTVKDLGATCRIWK